MLQFKETIETISGTRDMGTILDEIKSIQSQMERFGAYYTDLDTIASSSNNPLSSKVNKLLQELQVYDNCDGIKDTTQKNICEYNFKSQVVELIAYEDINENMKKKIVQLQELANRISASKDPKESQDLLNSITAVTAGIEADKKQIDMLVAKSETRRKVDETRKEQNSAKIRNTPVEIPNDYKMDFGKIMQNSLQRR